MYGDDQKDNVFKVAKRMVKANKDIIEEQCIWNDDPLLPVRGEDKKMGSYHEQLLNTEFAWYRR